MQKITLTFLISISILIITFPCLAQDDQNQQSNITLSDLPKDVWNEVFGWINSEYNAQYWLENNKNRAKSNFYSYDQKTVAF